LSRKAFVQNANWRCTCQKPIVKNSLVAKGLFARSYDPVDGARPLRRAIQREILVYVKAKDSRYYRIDYGATVAGQDTTTNSVGRSPITEASRGGVLPANHRHDFRVGRKGERALRLVREWAQLPSKNCAMRSNSLGISNALRRSSRCLDSGWLEFMEKIVVESMRSEV